MQKNLRDGSLALHPLPGNAVGMEMSRVAVWPSSRTPETDARLILYKIDLCCHIERNRWDERERPRLPEQENSFKNCSQIQEEARIPKVTNRADRESYQLTNKRASDGNTGAATFLLVGDGTCRWRAPS